MARICLSWHKGGLVSAQLEYFDDFVFLEAFIEASALFGHFQLVWQVGAFSGSGFVVAGVRFQV